MECNPFLRDYDTVMSVFVVSSWYTALCFQCKHTLTMLKKCSV